MVDFFAIILAVIATFTISFGTLHLKVGSKKVRSIKTLIFNKRITLAVFLYATSAILYIWGLKYGDVSVLYPIISLSYVWVCLLSIKFLKERMNLYKWVGIIVIIIGVTLIGIGG